MMTLEDGITEAQDFIEDPPKNEQNTREWIISPLLRASGYAPRDIESCMVDSTRQFPDYTLLPNHSSATYYLEAKAWNVPLDLHVRQALDYTNHNGKRFVVLTNGQNWRLYDNTIQGLLADKLVTQASLRDTLHITDFLTMLSKTEVLNGSLEQMAAETRQRKLQEAHDLQERILREEELQSLQKRQMKIKSLLSTTLPDLLKDAEGELVALMADYLSQKEELQDIMPEILSTWFNENLHLPAADRAEQAICPSQTQMVHPILPVKQSGSIWTLKELQSKPIDGKKSSPAALQMPDGTQISVASWVQLAVHVVEWLLQQSRPMPIPFESGHRTRWFLNHDPEHKRQGQRRKFKPISAQGKTVYMDADRSGEMFIKDLYALCLAMQISPDTFHIIALL